MHRRSTSRNTVVSCLTLAVVCLGTVACSDDEPPARGDAATTTVASPSGPAESTTTLAPPKSFAEALSAASEQIDAAGTDECKLVQLGGWISAFPAPSTRDEVQQAVATMSRYLRALALSARQKLPDVSRQLSTSADDLDAQASAVGYDPATVNSPTGLTALGSDPLLKAMGKLNEHASTACK